LTSDERRSPAITNQEEESEKRHVDRRGLDNEHEYGTTEYERRVEGDHEEGQYRFRFFGLFGCLCGGVGWMEGFWEKMADVIVLLLFSCCRC
jgi:hypothetical protein